MCIDHTSLDTIKLLNPLITMSTTTNFSHTKKRHCDPESEYTTKILENNNLTTNYITGLYNNIILVFFNLKTCGRERSVTRSGTESELHVEMMMNDDVSPDCEDSDNSYHSGRANIYRKTLSLLLFKSMG